MLLDVRLQPKVSSLGDQSEAMPCVEQELPASSLGDLGRRRCSLYSLAGRGLVDTGALYP